MPNNASCKLISMTAFVIDYYSNEGYADLQTLNLMVNYAQFLKKNVFLGMFIPVNSEGEILKVPKNYSSWKSLAHNKEDADENKENASFEEYKIYKKAENNCLFKGFEIAYNGYSVIRIIASYDHSIELSFNKNNLKCQTINDVEALTVFEEIYLSKAALKAIGIKK
ncbi:hypothetical protein CHRY9390_02656 [Chryseobacterium aquaeductus]|uniref:Uncharacterized protein n=1 Tax=Chryseobacterium aquaeductus TaxID=2675056 RepID=A0A9N8MIT5_9FLAO|nr:hypothetical protein [Chryseobacterium aquaeductus]CAA7331938.1 hypothetical protein CHRY9390_02656 [Chryseobacterium potabilaquae]CAD7813431.1 hypothetical protein CHRY9390_02656 [Chryseobacterium aquaeductus]